MTYYLLLKGDTEKDVIYETNVLGEESFEVFYPSMGFNMLHKIINQKPELLEDIRILDDHKTSHTITEFLDKLDKWRIKKA
jgi:prephenate dehydrogenase|tara:strand:+ start:902 stop:1144 length:243 start_codon:yes stop_codon:yes gene_type:complete